MSSPAFVDLIQPGPRGDETVEVRLTAREVAAIQYLVSLSIEMGGPVALAYRAMEEFDLGDRWSIAFQSAQARLGIATARVLRPECVAEFSALLARIDQDQASIDHGTEA